MRKLLSLYVVTCSLLFAAWQCFAQLPMTGVGLGAPAGGGGCSQATTLTGRMDGSQNTSAITTAVCGMVTDGTWTILDGLYVFAVNSSGNAALNWVASNSVTVHGTPTFTANRGYTGDASAAYLDTGINPSTAGGNFALNSASVGACILNNRTTSQNYVSLGAFSGSSYAVVEPLTGTTLTADVNAAVFPTQTESTAQGATYAVRTSSANISFYVNGTATAGSPFTDASNAIPNANVFILGFSSAGTPSQLTADQLAYAFFGGGLTATQASNLRSRLETYITAVGTASVC